MRVEIHLRCLRDSGIFNEEIFEGAKPAAFLASLQHLRLEQTTLITRLSWFLDSAAEQIKLSKDFG